jgi:homoserine O-acetyltransferase
LTPTTPNYPFLTQCDFLIHDARFQSGETLAELRLHYTTLGAPARDAGGVVRNAVLILHGTGGSGQAFLRDQFAGVLFGPGQLLDAARYFIILPDAIGHGQSSKPSDGLRMRFPRYTYDDMVAAQHRLLMEALVVNHLRLVMGTSMGGMHTWLWGARHPRFMDALMPLASLPAEIAGRNRMMRRMIIDAIRGDPEWSAGEYTSQPRGLVAAVHTLLFMVSSPLRWHQQAPTPAAADALLDELIQGYLAQLDANDLLYQIEAARDYDPTPELERIAAPLLAINSADDEVNPPELGILEQAITRVRRGRAVVLPTSAATNGHRTHSLPAIWQQYLIELLDESEGSTSD